MSSAEVLVLERCTALHVHVPEQYRFGLCVAICTEGMRRHGVAGYQPSSIAVYPHSEESWVDEMIVEYVTRKGR